MAYPDYYLKPFHAYSEGNLNWLAAFEAESATYSMALRVWPAEVKAGQLSWRDAQARLRDSFTDALRAYAKQHGARLLQPGAEALDVGCSVGISTRAVRGRVMHLVFGIACALTHAQTSAHYFTFTSLSCAPRFRRRSA